MFAYYRFKHSTEWLRLYLDGLVPASAFAEWIQRRHNFKHGRIILEDAGNFVRPWSSVVVKYVPNHWVSREPAVLPVVTVPNTHSEEDKNIIEREFGPNPYNN